MWPLALANMIREGSDDPIWSRLHARQAFVFGLLVSLLFIVMLSFPLLAVIFVPAISTGATIAVYACGFAGDLLVGIVFLFVAARYSARAAHGELFTIPLVTSIVDTCFRIGKP